VSPLAALSVALALLLSEGPAEAARKGRTELEQALRKEGQTDFAARANKALEPYSRAPDPIAAMIVDTNTPVVDVPAMTAVLNDTAVLLLKGWEGQPIPVRVMVRADMREYATVHSSGLILISLGMIDKLGNLNAVAAVIAHEIGHLINGDPGRRERFDRIFSTAAGVAASAGIYAEVGAQKPFATKGQAQIKMTPKMEDQFVAGFAVQALVSDSLAPALDAGDEYDADRLGADLLAKSPFSADSGGQDFIGALVRAEAMPSERLNAAAGLFKGLMAVRLGSKTGTMGDAGKAGVGVGVLVANSAIDEIARAASRKSGGEADAEKRKAQFKAYADAWPGDPVNGFPTARTQDPDYVRLTGAFTAARASKPWAAAKEGVKASDGVFKAMDQRSLSLAARASGASEIVAQAAPMPSINQLPEVPTVPASFWAKGAVAKLGGQTTEAARLFETGAKHPLFPRDGLYQIGTIHLARGDSKGLRAAIDRGVARAGRDTGFLDLKVGLARLEGRMAEAETLAARCLTEGGGQTYANCTAALGYDPACTPQTAEGRAAMAGATTKKGFGDLLKRGLNIPGIGGQEAPATACPAS
jgi:hypothetical protein